MKNNLRNLLKRVDLWLIAILVLAAVLRLAGVGYPQEYYFDEVYHVYTAQQYAEGNWDALGFWQSSTQPGVAFEWTHPPFGKYVIYFFISVFGDNSVAWRLGPALAGIGGVLLLYLLAKRITGSRKWAALAAFLLAIEPFHISMSRIGTVDAILLFTILLCIYAYSCVRLSWLNSLSQSKHWWPSRRQLAQALLIGGLFGLAMATKWSALYVFPILALDLVFALFQRGGSFRKRLTWLLSVLFMTGVASLLVYLALNLPVVIMFGTQRFVELQQQMYWYHTQLVATHPFQSTPAQWLLSLKPVFMFYDKGVGFVAASANVGNHLLFGLVLGGLAWLVWRLLDRRRTTDTGATRWGDFILLGYLFLFLPWVASPRIMFSYHYMPALPFALLALTLWWQSLWRLPGRIGKALVLALLVTASTWSLVLLPLAVALPVTQQAYDNFYSKFIYLAHR